MRRAFRAAGTAALAGTVLLRSVRIAENWQSVRRFYCPDGAGPLWFQAGLVFLLGPFAAALLAAAALWLRREAAGRLGLASACAAAFFTFSEGLTAFARAVNGNSGYVGAEPLLSALTCGISAATVFWACRTGRGKK